ncbi:MAG TPA: hypothetical protein VM240_04175 [Verrucomicrobiae bacterium]|nr:hypothetical protein [Verrucomicrobiae bacterium]
MIEQAVRTALRISLFRAGPQDFPFAASLTRLTVPLAVVVAFLQYRLTLPEVSAVVHALAWVGALAMFTFVLLHSRGLANRFRQTLDSLLVIDSAMTLVMLPALAAIAPHMLKLADDPELAREQPLPLLPALAVLVVSIWNFLVSAHVYRSAIDAPPGVGAMVALLGVIVTVSLAGAVGALVG